MISNPLISIIITTYNRPTLLNLCLRSALEVDYSPKEIIVVEDGSSELTQQVVAAYQDEVTHISKEHSGITASRNVGCHAANGEYIAFVDDDDLMHPQRLTILLAALANTPDAICAFGQGSAVDAEGRDLGQLIWPNLPRIQNIELITDGYEQMIRTAITLTPLNTLFSREAGKQIGWFDETFVHGCEDTDFFMRLNRLGPMVQVPEVITYVRRNTAGSLTKDKLNTAFSKIQLFEKHIRLNKQHGSHHLVRVLRDREYSFVKEIMLTRQNLRSYQRKFNVSLPHVLIQLGVKRFGYLIYLRFIKPLLK